MVCLEFLPGDLYFDKRQFNKQTHNVIMLCRIYLKEVKPFGNVDAFPNLQKF